MAKAPESNCLRCGRSKAEEPQEFSVRSRALKSGKPCISSYCKPCMCEKNRIRRDTEERECSVPGCPKKIRSLGYCGMHRSRFLKYGDPGEVAERRAPKGAGSTDKHGYRRAKRRRPGQSVMEHQQVMEAELDRPMRSHERVHHKNGVRSDNRPSNLELWSVSQPPGQRVEDKIAWAKEFLAEYLTAEEIEIWAKELR